MRTLVIPLHAEVEGGIHNPFLEMLLQRVGETAASVQTLQERAAELLPDSVPPPTIPVSAQSIHGRAGRVTRPITTCRQITQWR